MSSGIEVSGSLPPQKRILEADVAPYEDLVTCPMCGQDVTDEIGTPRIPTELVEDDSIALAFDEIPVYGYKCGRHRVDVLLCAPPTIAPETFASITAEINGEVSEVAVPRPIIEETLEVSL